MFSTMRSTANPCQVTQILQSRFGRNNSDREASTSSVKHEPMDEEMPGPPPSSDSGRDPSSRPSLPPLSEKEVMSDPDLPIPALGIPCIDSLLSIPSYPSTARECSDLLLIAAHHLNDQRSQSQSCQHSLSSAQFSLVSAQTSFSAAQNALASLQTSVRAAEEEKAAAEKALRAAEEKVRAAQEKVVASYHTVRSAEASVHGATREVSVWEGACAKAELRVRKVEEGWRLLDGKYGKVGRQHLRNEDVAPPGYSLAKS